MKKLFPIIILIGVICAICVQSEAGTKIGVRPIFESQAIAASGTATSTSLSLSDADGVFGYFLQVTGVGSAIKLEIYAGLTETGTFYQVGAAAADNIIVTAFGPTSGRNSDGIQAWYFDIPTPLFPFYKFKVTELNAAATVVTFKLTVK